jgi:plasmid stabilization system protein ParE
VSWVVRVRPEAELDLLISTGWYEGQRVGLGEEFLDEMARLIASLGDNALLYAELFEGVRRVLARRFPYVVSYQIVADDVVILSVLHVRRRRTDR